MILRYSCSHLTEQLLVSNNKILDLCFTHFIAAGSDFGDISTTIFFSSGSAVNASEMFDVSITGDVVFEGEEMFSLVLSSSNLLAIILNDTATVTIIDCELLL